MNRKTLVSIIVVLAIAVLAYLWISPNRTTDLEEGPEAEERTVQGEIISIDQSQVPVDGPTLISLETEEGLVTIAVPSMGFNLCVAKENIYDPFALESGTQIEVRGASEGGAISPCQSESHYLRIVE